MYVAGDQIVLLVGFYAHAVDHGLSIVGVYPGEHIGTVRVDYVIEGHDPVARIPVFLQVVRHHEIGGELPLALSFESSPEGASQPIDQLRIHRLGPEVFVVHLAAHEVVGEQGLFAGYQLLFGTGGISSMYPMYFMWVFNPALIP